MQSPGKYLSSGVAVWCYQSCVTTIIIYIIKLQLVFLLYFNTMKFSPLAQALCLSLKSLNPTYQIYLCFSFMITAELGKFKQSFPRNLLRTKERYKSKGLYRDRKKKERYYVTILNLKSKPLLTHHTYANFTLFSHTNLYCFTPPLSSFLSCPPKRNTIILSLTFRCL